MNNPVFHVAVRVAAIAVLIAASTAASPKGALAGGCDTSWNNVAFTGSWTADANWNNGAPLATENACLPAGSYIVIIDGSAAPTASTLQISAGVTLLIAGVSPGPSTLTVSGTVTNAGVIQIGNASSHANEATLAAGLVTNTGFISSPGTGSNNLNANIDNQASGTINNLAPLSIGKTNVSVTNNGTWHVGVFAQINVGTNPTVNFAGGTIDGGNFFVAPGTVDHTGGTVTANVVLQGGTLKPRSATGGGTFMMTRTSGILGTDIAVGETVIVAGGYLSQDGVMNSAVSRVNNGTIKLRSDGAPHTGKIVFTGGATLTNNGTIIANDEATQGGGARVIEAPLTNNGTININYDTDFDLAGATFIQNSGGTTTLGAGKTLDLTGSAGTLALSGGTLTGTGTLVGQLQNDGGTVAPGSSPGVLTVSNFTQTAGGTLAIEIGGTTAGTESDQLVVTGNASLNGTLALTTINAFVPGLSFEYDVMTYATHGGVFTSVTGTNAGGGKTYVLSNGIDAQLITVVGGGITRQPDGQIALGSGTFVGNNIYNTNATGQSKSKTTTAGSKVTFTIRIGNDGTGAKDKFKVHATGTNVTGFTFTCKRGTTNITNAVNNGTYTTGKVKVGKSVIITCSVAITNAAAHSSQVGKLLTITSFNDSNQKDAVQLTVGRT